MKEFGWVRIMIGVIAIGLGVTVTRWAPASLEFLRVNSDLIQGAQAGLQIVIWAGVATVLFFTFRRPRTVDQSPAEAGAEQRVSGQGNAAAMHGGVAIAGQTVSVTIAPDTPGQDARPSARGVELERTRERYLQFIADRYRYLDFKGMGVSDRVPLKLPLRDMYVPLKARCELPCGETLEREALVAGRALGAQADGEVRCAKGTEEVQALWERHSGVIILGDPGSGKTTFLKQLALRLAEKPGDPPRLPALVPLSAYANALALKDTSMDAFLVHYFEDEGAGLPIGELLRATLAAGRAVVMFDGLDEVRDVALRSTVVQRVETFYTFHRRAGNKFLLTSRIIGYREVRPSGEDLVECTLADFDESDIRAFVERWTSTVERATHDSAQSLAARRDADRECADLLEAIGRHPGVRRLAANPLLLTILALMKRQGVRLPERRVELYHKYVEVLLATWNRARGLGRPPTGDMDVPATLRVLAPLALWMHAESPGVGLVKAQALHEKLRGIYAERGEPDPEGCACRFLDDVRQYAGLLLERGAGQYGFIHLTFEEYLSGVAIAQMGQQDVKPVADAIAARVAQPAWREPSLLALGYLGIVQQREEAASVVVEDLLARPSDPPGALAVLAAEAVVDTGSVGVTLMTRRRAAEAMLATMHDARVASAMRAAAGNALAGLGDPRFRADLWHLPATPTLGFIDIPAGPFSMGSKDGRDDEKPRHSVLLPTYCIGQYPVTVAQFRAFVEATGFPVGDPDCLKGLANHPVVWVAWHEALAYCEWLTGALCGSAETPADLRALLDRGWRVTLPSEAEWEKAARGTDGRVYPWGNEWDKGRVNWVKSGINDTSPVGCFPDGASPYGAQEMSGNVWEWTRSNKMAYPYVPADGREDLGGDDGRVLRGGSWQLDFPGDFRCAFRFRYSPSYWVVNLGFRCVLVSPGR